MRCNSVSPFFPRSIAWWPSRFFLPAVMVVMVATRQGKECEGEEDGGGAVATGYRNLFEASGIVDGNLGVKAAGNTAFT